ncbi:MAG: flagellar basal body L-ring protein FlgH [Halanaerobiales bacterium]
MIFSIKSKMFLFVILFLLVFCLAVPVYSEDNSLWSDDAADAYKDRPDYEEGDIITVVIEEDANAVQSANTDTSQESNVEGEAGAGVFDFLPSFGFGYSDENGADGSTERSGTLEADITTQITDVMSNGNYQIVGSKTININGEEQVIKLTGVIRPEDVDRDNTITSQRLADAEIEYEGVGVVGDKQESGVIEKIMNWFF